MGRVSRAWVGVGVLAGLLAGCQSTYYGAWEKLGWHKRDILVDRVEEGRESQEGARQEFRSALEKFRSVVNVQEPGLEALQQRYDQLKSELDRCEARAGDVSQRIRSIQEVGEALFAEWQKELEQYQNADLRRRSEQQLQDTRQRYGQLVQAMQRVESRMQPVLGTFRDQVLFLKHNLNARAVASLQAVSTQLEEDTNRLIADMERAIAEADRFVKEMTGEGEKGG